MRTFTLKTLALVAGMMLSNLSVMAGDGTKENPYTVSELNAQKEALAASGATVWVKARRPTSSRPKHPYYHGTT